MDDVSPTMTPPNKNLPRTTTASTWIPGRTDESIRLAVLSPTTPRSTGLSRKRNPIDRVPSDPSPSIFRTILAHLHHVHRYFTIQTMPAMVTTVSYFDKLHPASTMIPNRRSFSHGRASPKTMPPAKSKQNTTRRKWRNVDWVSGLNIDGKDYDIMKKILCIDDDDDRFFSFRSFSVTDRTFEIYYSKYRYVGRVGIAGKDDECRVWNLDLTYCNTLVRNEESELIILLPELIIQLDIQLEDLRRLDLEIQTVETATATLQWIGRLKNLRALTVTEDSRCGKMLNFSDEIGKLTKLQELNLTWCTEMISLPSSIGNLTNLRKLNLAYSSKLKSRLPSLEELNLTNTGMVLLPSSIGDLTNLKKLDLSYNKKLQSLPDEIIGRLTSLEELYLADTGMVSLPSSIGDLTNLKILDLSYNKKLQSLPDEIIGRLTSLEELYLADTGMVSLPSSIGDLTNLQTLDLSCKKKLQSLPDDIIGRLTSLEQQLYFAELYLADTGMVSLPSSIGNLTNLQTLDLSGNEKLLSLPDEILNITRKCPFLVCLGPFLVCHGHQRYEVPQRCVALVDSLLRNRIRSLLLAPSSKIPPSLWPSIFHNANHASSNHNCVRRAGGCGYGLIVQARLSKRYPVDSCDCLRRHKLPQSDAIFHLLVELRAIDHIISGQV